MLLGNITAVYQCQVLDQHTEIFNTNSFFDKLEKNELYTAHPIAKTRELI